MSESARPDVEYKYLIAKNQLFVDLSLTPPYHIEMAAVLGLVKVDVAIEILNAITTSGGQMEIAKSKIGSRVLGGYCMLDKPAGRLKHIDKSETVVPASENQFNAINQRSIQYNHISVPVIFPK